jgi:hypothetical protein
MVLSMRTALVFLLLAPATAFQHAVVSARQALLRSSMPLACAASGDNPLEALEALEAKLEEAVAREDYEAAAEIKAELDGSPAQMQKLYAGLQKRASQLASRRDMMKREREHLKNLAGMWQTSDAAQRAMWDHWFTEYGEAARDKLLAADGEARELADLMEEYPDWVEPQNRLATLRYLQGDLAGSVELCLKILRQKPWHFGAASGIVLCYAKLGDAGQARYWAAEAMPQSNPERRDWVDRMVAAIDERLAELDEISGSASS